MNDEELMAEFCKTHPDKWVMFAKNSIKDLDNFIEVFETNEIWGYKMFERNKYRNFCLRYNSDGEHYEGDAMKNPYEPFIPYNNGEIKIGEL